MRYESLISTHNLKLAWRRINTGRNLQYKRFFREFYLVYESAVDENLHELHKRLQAKVWRPTHPIRIYLPKPSGLQRPISLMGIEDQILLQAIANALAQKMRKKRQHVELQTVFSNILAEPGDSIFFTERWQSTYRKFQEKCIELFEKGFRWAAHFDLAAYYDTISHELLIRDADPSHTEDEIWRYARRWLQTWSAAEDAAMKGHGIPQGPIASNFLAEAFFLPIDLYLTRQRTVYIRYVDDIRLFGKTKNEVVVSAIMLEQQCRHRGLIPQSAKFDVRELGSPQDAMGALPSIAPTDSKEAFESEMPAIEAHRILASAIASRPFKIKDKSRFRYVMYRAPADRKFLNKVLKIMPRHPEHIDAFAAYYANFGRQRRIARAVLKYLQAGVPYSYVRGELWHIVARLGGEEELRDGLSLARNDARKRLQCVALSWGVMHFLMRCEEMSLSRMGRRLQTEAPQSRALLATIFPDKEFTRTGTVKKLLKGTLEEQLAAARELQKRKVSLDDIAVRQRELSSICKNSLRALGVICRRHRTESDWIADHLETLYCCPPRPVWRHLLTTEYEHALQFLVEASARFSGAYSEWLALQDSFNDVMVRQFFRFLANAGLPGHSKTMGGGKLVKYGALIATGAPFDRHYPSEAASFRKVHERRNRIPSAHPYNEKGGAKNRWVSKEERDELVKHVCKALDGISADVERVIGGNQGSSGISI